MIYKSVLVLIITSCLRSEFYYSPGIQIGFTSERTLFFSTQLTIGVGISDLIRNEPSFLMELIYPGMTIGARLYSKTKFKRLYFYNDLQIAIIGIAGYGSGYLYGNRGKKYKKSKMWIGIPFIPFSYDKVDFLEDGKSQLGERLISGYGIFGLATIPFGGWPSWY